MPIPPFFTKFIADSDRDNSTIDDKATFYGMGIIDMTISLARTKAVHSPFNSQIDAQTASSRSYWKYLGADRRVDRTIRQGPKVRSGSF